MPRHAEPIFANTRIAVARYEDSHSLRTLAVILRGTAGDWTEWRGDGACGSAVRRQSTPRIPARPPPVMLSPDGRARFSSSLTLRPVVFAGGFAVLRSFGLSVGEPGSGSATAEVGQQSTGLVCGDGLPRSAMPARPIDQRTHPRPECPLCSPLAPAGLDALNDHLSPIVHWGARPEPSARCWFPAPKIPRKEYQCEGQGRLVSGRPRRRCRDNRARATRLSPWWQPVARARLAEGLPESTTSRARPDGRHRHDPTRGSPTYARARLDCTSRAGKPPDLPGPHASPRLNRHWNGGLNADLWDALENRACVGRSDASRNEENRRNGLRTDHHPYVISKSVTER
jgi:hypothetical protein